MRRQQDTYKEVKVYESPGWVVRVHIPDLTPAERSQRMEEIKKAAADLVFSTRKGRKEI